MRFVMKLSLREVTIEDAEMLYRWRNHPKVRESSFCSDAIELEGHINWLKKKIDEPDCLMLLAFNESDEPIGTVRYDIDQSSLSAEIDIYLNPDCFGLGYGTALLNESIEYLKNARSQLIKVVAKVLPQNITSCKVFEKSGFVNQYNCYEHNLKGTE